MSKVRVYEVAKQLGMENKSLVDLIVSHGFAEVKNHASTIDEDVVDRVKQVLLRQKAPAEQKVIAAGVVKRRKVQEPAAAEPLASARVEVPPPSPSGAVPPIRRARREEPSSGELRPADVAAEAVAVIEPELPPTPEPEPSPEPEPEAPAAVVEAEPEAPSSPAPASAEPALAAPSMVDAPLPEPLEGAAAPAVEPLATAPLAPPIAEPPAPKVEPPPSSEPPRRSVAPKTGIEVWAGRPGVPMPPPPVSRPVPPAARRVEYDMRAPSGTPTRPGQQPLRVPQRPGQRRPGQNIRKGPVAVSTKEMSAEKKVIRIEEKINLQTLAARMSLKATEVLMKLMSLGMQGAHINSSLDADTAKVLAGEFGWEVEDVAVTEETRLTEARGEDAKSTEGAEPRPPIVTVMGHVDHGKTSLLDQIRKSNVAVGEAGGITQHIGAYRVSTPRGPVCFLDTPGHEAFTAMRARGAGVTDIVVLVVAADDGVMPQTREAVNHARAAKVPIVVAVNKVDKPEANPERVRRQLMELGLVPDDLGGDTLYVNVSAKTRVGVDDLLDTLALQTDVMELRASPSRAARGVVIEALLDRGKGPVARVIVTDGTLRTGDFVLSGPAVGKVRAMTDDRGRMVQSAGPSTPVEILGLSDVPNAGDTIDVIKDPKKAQEIAEQRRQKARGQMATATKFTLEDFAARASAVEQQELRVIVKGDVQGSVEALGEALTKLTTPKVRLAVINASVGAITEGDVNLAIASKAIVIGFNVRPAGKAVQLAETEGVQIRQYSIIYNVIDDVRAAMEGLLAPTYRETEVGKAEVRKVFNLSKAGTIAGCMVIQGLVKRNAKARVRRAGEVIHESKVTSLKRFKDDVKDVAEGFECGIGVDGFEQLQEGDIIEVVDVEEVRQKL